MSYGSSHKAVGVVRTLFVILIIVVFVREFTENRSKHAAGETFGRSEHVKHGLVSQGPVFHNTLIDYAGNGTETVASSYTCDSNTSAAFDSTGKPCIDMDKLSLKQALYAVTAKEASYICCAIPKNGCTFHLGIMQRLIGINERYERTVHVHNSAVSSQLKVSPNIMTRLMLNPKIEKYVVVRNPLQRALSAFLDKAGLLSPPRNRTPQAFKEWVYEELKPDMDPKQTNPHWRPQVYFCGFNMRDFWRRFRLFRFEKPAEFVDFLEELLPEWLTKEGWRGDDNSSLRESVLGPRRRTRNTNELFFEFVPTLELYDYLADVYKEDIRGLGYQQEVSDMREELARRIQRGTSSDTDSEYGTSSYLH